MILMLSGLFVYSSLTKTTIATETAKNINKMKHLHYAYQHNGQSNKIKCYDGTIYFINFCIGHFISPHLFPEPLTSDHLIMWEPWKCISFDTFALTKKKWNLFPISSDRYMWLFFSFYFFFFSFVTRFFSSYPSNVDSHVCKFIRYVYAFRWHFPFNLVM